MSKTNSRTDCPWTVKRADAIHDGYLIPAWNVEGSLKQVSNHPVYGTLERYDMAVGTFATVAGLLSLFALFYGFVEGGALLLPFLGFVASVLLGGACLVMEGRRMPMESYTLTVYTEELAEEIVALKEETRGAYLRKEWKQVARLRETLGEKREEQHRQRDAVWEAVRNVERDKATPIETVFPNFQREVLANEVTPVAWKVLEEKRVPFPTWGQARERHDAVKEAYGEAKPLLGGEEAQGVETCLVATDIAAESGDLVGYARAVRDLEIAWGKVHPAD